MRRALSTFAILAALAASAGRAEASFTVSLASTAASGPNYVYNYVATLAAGDILRSGDYFRIYDFAGFVVGSAIAPAGWSVSVLAVNPTTPPSVNVYLGDDPNRLNLTFTYTGATTLAGPQTFSGFSAVSNLASGGAQKNYIGQVQNGSGGPTNDSVGAVGVPGVAVPEPASVALLGLGGLGILGLSLRSRRLARA